MTRTAATLSWVVGIGESSFAEVLTMVDLAHRFLLSSLINVSYTQHQQDSSAACSLYHNFLK